MDSFKINIKHEKGIGRFGTFKFHTNSVQKSHHQSAWGEGKLIWLQHDKSYKMNKIISEVKEKVFKSMPIAWCITLKIPSYVVLNAYKITKWIMYGFHNSGRVE